MAQQVVLTRRRPLLTLALFRPRRERQMENSSTADQTLLLSEISWMTHYRQLLDFVSILWIVKFAEMFYLKIEVSEHVLLSKQFVIGYDL